MKIIIELWTVDARGAVELRTTPTTGQIVKAAKAGDPAAGFAVAALAKIKQDADRMAKEERSKLVLPPGYHV